jgi:hypothetical protein
MMELKSATVTLDGLPLRVDYEYNGPDKENPHASDEVVIIEIYLMQWEILSIMDDAKISEVRRKLLNGEGKEV